MKRFTNQSNGSHRGHSLMGRAMLRRFALFFPMILLMLLFLPARMVAQKAASSSKYIATYDSDTETLTFEKYEGESLPSESEWVEDGTSVFDMFKYDCQNIKNIVINESFKTFTPTTLSRFFGGLVKLETITGLEYLNTANVTDMSLLFNNCQKLTSLDVTHFNTAKVTNMYRMFNACGLTSLDLSNFNTATVENMELMFSGCSNLKTIYASDKFKTAAVAKSKNMFSYCGSLSGDIDWTSDKATDKTYAKTGGGYFRDKAYDNRPWVKYADGTLTFRCGYKKTLGENEYELNSGEKLPKWYTHDTEISKVVFEASFANARPTTCYAWFKNFTFLKQIEGIENLNTENVKDMRDMFYDCSGLISLDVTHFNTENVTSMSSMFNSCRGLTSLDVTHFNTENVTSMSSMFNSCRGLTSLDVTHFNTANVKNMSFMFSSCNKLKEIYVSDKFVTDDVIDSEYMFSYCGSLSGDIDWTSDKATDKTYAKTGGGYFRDKAYDNRPWVKYADGTLTFRCGYKKTLGENEYELNSGEKLPKWYTHDTEISKVVFEASFANARPTSCYAWFQDFKNLTQIEGIENLNTANVTDMSYMFKNCSNLAKLDVTHFNTAKVTTMNSMFTRCSNLAELDVTHFNTANVTNMYEMFNGCSNLVKLDITHFNTAKVTTMFGMFTRCSNLVELDVTHFNTAEVTDMSYMFYDCSNLAELDVTHFNTAKVTIMNGMFSGCSNLTELDLTHFNTANVTNMYAMFFGCKSLTTIYVSDEFVITNITIKTYSLFFDCIKLKGAIGYNKSETNYKFANYKTGYFTKLVGKNGDEKIGAAGKTLTTDNLVLDDGKDFVAYEPFAAKAASYSRTVEGTTWATLCLPFEVSLADKNFRAFKLLSADEGTETVELEEIETNIEAGTPVIIKMKDGETKLDFTVANKEITNEVKPVETANGNYQLQGLYTQKEFSKDTDNNCYIVKGDKLMNPAKLLGTSTKSVGSKPFRAYMVDNSSAPAAGARMFSISVGGSTTAILAGSVIQKASEADYSDEKVKDFWDNETNKGIWAD